jgi:hypothetical protein
VLFGRKFKKKKRFGKNKKIYKISSAKYSSSSSGSHISSTFSSNFLTLFLKSEEGRERKRFTL